MSGFTPAETGPTGFCQSRAGHVPNVDFAAIDQLAAEFERVMYAAVPDSGVYRLGALLFVQRRCLIIKLSDCFRHFSVCVFDSLNFTSIQCVDYRV